MDPISNILQMLTKSQVPGVKTPAKKAASKKVPVSTKKAEIAKLAKQALVAGNPGLFMLNTDEGRAAIAGASRYGVPFEAVNRLVAAGRDIVGYGPDDTMGFDQKNFDRNLAAIRKNQDAAISKSYTGAGAGILGGALVSGGVLTKGAQLTGNVLSRIPGLEKVGRVIAGSQTLRASEKAKNLAKLTGTGAVIGAGEGAIRGGDAGDIASSTAIGAVAAPATVGVMKGLGYISRPVVDLFASKNYGQILRRITEASSEEIQAARTAYKARTNGAEPTLFEILPKGDRDRISKLIGGTAPKVQEQAAEAIQQRARNVEGEMLNIVDDAVAPRVGAVQTGLADDLAVSRGAVAPSPDEAALASQAARSPLDMEILRSQEAGNIMRPFDDLPAYQAVEELFPNVPELQTDGSVKYVVTDKEVAKLIGDAAGVLKLGNQVTVDNVTKIVKGLQKRVKANGTDAAAAQRAINHIEDTFTTDHPAAAAAMSQMKEAFAGKSRVLSGFDEGKLSRTREQFSGDKQTGINVFDTPEGSAGRALGQTAALRNSFSGTPQDAMRGVGKLAEDTGLQRAVAANLDDTVAAKLTDAARAQETGLRALGDARKASERKIEEADISVLGDAMLAFNPASFPLTRAAAVARLVKIPTLGEKKASYLVDLLFSQDSTKIKAGIRLLNDTNQQAREALFDLSAAVVGASQSVQALPNEADYAANDAANPMPTDEVDYSTLSDEELLQQIQGGEPDYSAMSDEELLQQIQGGEQGNAPYGARVISAVFPDAVITDDVRDPNSRLGQANPDSFHVRSDGAVDVRPIPGVTFEEFIAKLEGEGHEIVEAIDEVNNPSGHATGPHWHVVFA